MDEFKNSSNNYKDTENERKDCMEKTTSTGTTNNCTENEGRDSMEKTTSTGTADNCTENEGRDIMEKTTSTGITNNGTENEGKDIIDGNKPSNTADNGTENEGKDIIDGNKPSGTADKDDTVHTNNNENDEQKYGFKAESAQSIQNDDYAVKDFIIDGVITPGVNILGGPKKHGKSLLALNMALSIAGEDDFWGRKTEHGRVLYMMLEDTKKRAKDRMNEMLEYLDAPESLYFAYGTTLKGPGLSQGIGKYIKDHSDTKAIIIDVLELIRTAKSSNVSEYAHDYNEIGSLQKVANKYGVAMIVVTHCKKGRESDWVNEISGGVGVTGAADTILMLRKKGNNSPEGILNAIGRDVPETRLAVRLDEKTLKWELVGTADEVERKSRMEKYHSSTAAKAVRLLLEKNGGHWSGTSRELLDFGLKELGEPIAKNESALARKINDMDELFLNDSIIHTRPDPNGGVAGRIHHFKLEKPTQEAQAEEDYELPFDGQPEADYELPFDGQPEADYELPFDWKHDEDGELPFD